jgi:N-acetylmuramoyl-L-alanine amidase
MRIFFIFSIVVIHFELIAQTICIDPGHGYGPSGENLDDRTAEEITTNCAVGLLLRDSLESHGYTVLMTRENSDNGSWTSLTQRAELADEYESERLLSIHCNGGGGTGTETFWCYVNSPNKSIDETFSLLTQNNMSLYGEWRSRRSIEDFEYLGYHLGVLKGSAPGCLNEIGFVDRPADLEKLLDEDWRKIFAQAYRIAIDESFNQDYPSGISINTITDFEVYPIPFEDNIFIRSMDKRLKINHIEIFNTTGQKVKQIQIHDILNQQISVDVGNLLAGVYVLSIFSEKNSYNKVILKR